VKDKDGRWISYHGVKQLLLKETKQMDLPQFPLDDLIEHLGGPHKVGRREEGEGGPH